MNTIPEKSIPEMHGNITSHIVHTLDEQRSDCVKCDRINGEESMVQCDICQTWWHFACAGVSDSIENRAWSCANCQVDEIASVASGSRASHTSGKSGNSARINLQLEKLEELQAMQKRFIEDKYKLLESQLELDEENVSVRSKSSRVSKRSKIAKVVQWVNNCAEQSETPPEKSTEARLSTMPPASSNRTAPATTTAIAPGVQNLMQPPSSSLLSPLKHPALSNQRSATIQKISMQVPEDSKTIPKQDKARTGVFNKITGTVPLAQSTPTQTQSSALLLACSDTRNPQTTSVAHPPESSSGMPENQPISALASMPPVLVSSAPPHQHLYLHYYCPAICT
ncbi:uncharacterized protein LOC134209311 [Armigeres subalbatus]|uniref:uncharacterized protein LOC134209311 n=1 Tax=Armigeres subalbatus TaxID=124917 RepID=UPI002ED098B8